MTAFVEEHRAEYGVEPICKVLPIAPSTFYLQQARKRTPEPRPEREKRDEVLRPEIVESGTRATTAQPPARIALNDPPH
jgi:putative transposase